MIRALTTWCYRLLFLAVMSGGCLVILLAYQALPVRQAAAPRKLPPPLAKYLGREYYPEAAEPDPRTASGPTVREAISALGENDPDDVMERAD